MGMQTTVTIILVVLVGLLLFVWFFRSNIFHGKTAAPSHSAPNPAEGIYSLALGDTEAALKSFKYLINHGTPKPEIYLSIAVLLRLRGNAANAVQINEALLMRAMPPEVMSAALEEALRCYRITGSLHNAGKYIDSLDEALLPEAILLRGELLAAAGNYDGALKKYARYTKATGDDAGKHLSRVYLRMAEAAKDSNARLKAIRTAIKTDPGSREAYIALANHYFAENNTAAGLDACREMIGQDLLRGEEDISRMEEIYYKHSSLEELLSQMTSRIARNSTCPVPYLFIAKYYTKKHENERAADILKEFTRSRSVKAAVLKALARFTSDDILLAATAGASPYECAECGSAFDEYSEICPICSGIRTIDYN